MEQRWPSREPWLCDVPLVIETWEKDVVLWLERREIAQDFVPRGVPHAVRIGRL